MSMLDPVVHLVTGFRWSFSEAADDNFGVSLAKTIFHLAVGLAIVGWMFRTGCRLKNWCST
jgi:ABC-2 type transport system permease protein